MSMSENIKMRASYERSPDRNQLSELVLTARRIKLELMNLAKVRLSATEIFMFVLIQKFVNETTFLIANLNTELIMTTATETAPELIVL